MRVLLVGTSSLAQTLIPLLRERCELLTAGRKGCDVELDLCSRDIQIPDGIDCVVNLAAAFGGKEPTDILQTMDVNVLGVMKLCHASSKAGAKHLVHISSIFGSRERVSLLRRLLTLKEAFGRRRAVLRPGIPPAGRGPEAVPDLWCGTRVSKASAIPVHHHGQGPGP